MSDANAHVRTYPRQAEPHCRRQLLVDAPLQFYVVGRVVALCVAVATVTAAAYVGVDCYVSGRAPTALSLVPLLLAVVVTTPLVAWRALVMSQQIVAPLVRLLAWTRRAPVHTLVDGTYLRLRAGDPSADLVTALQRAIVERTFVRRERHPDARENPNGAATPATE